MIDADLYVQIKNAQHLTQNKGLSVTSQIISDAGGGRYSITIPQYNQLTGEQINPAVQIDYLTTMQEKLQQAQTNVDNLTVLVEDIQTFAAQSVAQPAQDVVMP